MYRMAIQQDGTLTKGKNLACWLLNCIHTYPLNSAPCRLRQAAEVMELVWMNWF